MPDYLLFRVLFAFLDYEKPAASVFLENILMLLFWAFVGTQGALLFRKSQGKEGEKNNPLLPAVLVMAAVILGLVLNMAFPSGNGQGFGSAGWSAPRRQIQQILQEKTQQMLLLGKAELESAQAHSRMREQEIADQAGQTIKPAKS